MILSKFHFVASSLNPWMYSEALTRNPKAFHWYQGIVAIDDCPEDVGGFCCVRS